MSKSGTKPSDTSTTLTKSKVSQTPSTARKQNHQPTQAKIENYLKDDLVALYCPPLDKGLINGIMGVDNEVDELRRAFDDLVLKPRFAHGKTIQKDEPYFRCLDCEVIKNTNQRTYICRFCFEKKSHKGHRFLLINDATGNETCDCGNESLLDHKWHCPDHGTCHQAEFDKLLEIVPSDFKKRFMQVIKQAIYEITFACEVQRLNLQGNIRISITRMIEAILNVFNHCLRFNSVFLVLLSHVLTRKMKQPTVYRHFTFIDERHAKNNPQIVEQYVENLTYLEALMGNSLYFKEEHQKELREVLLRLSCAEVFKKQLVTSFHKIAHTLFKIQPERPFVFSDLSYLTMQIYASEENCFKVIDECSFNQIIEVIRCYAKNYEPSLDVGHKVLTRLLHLFELILEKEWPGKKLVQKDGVITKFIDVIAEFQKNSSYSVKTLATDLKFSNTEQNILDYFEFERKIFSIIERLNKNIGYILDTEGWDRRPELYLIDWGERATEDEHMNPTGKGMAHLNLPLQRSMIAYLQYSVDRLETEKLIARLDYIRRASPDGIIHLIKQALSTIGLMRQTMIKIDGWNVDRNKVVEKYFTQEEGLSYFDYDFTFVQLFSLLISEDELNMFELYYKNFFGGDEELVKLFESGNFAKATDVQVKCVEDFLMFMVQLLHGEISFFNIFYRGPCLTDHGSKKVLDQIHRKVLITFLHKTYQYAPIKYLKYDFRHILRGDIFHEKILKDIADIEKSTKNFKLKKGYSSLFDSFYIYSDKMINNKIISNVRYQNRKPEIAELGNFTQSLQFLVGLQQKFYESHVVDWLSKAFEHYNKNACNILPALIKLIILPLKLLENSKKNPVSARFKERIVVPFFGTQTFYEKMKKALPKVDDPIIFSPLAKLINIFVPKSNIGNTANSSFALEPEDLKAFLDLNMSMDPSNVPDMLNQTGMTNGTATRIWDDKEMLCGICCKPVDLNSVDVGIPGFISKSNMNYWEIKGRKFRKPPQSGDKETLKLIVYLVRHRYNPYAGGLNAKEFDWMEGYVPPSLLTDFYPAFNSCMHYLHRSCYAKSFVPVAGSAREYECPVCKKLNNMFIGMEKVDAASRKLIEEQLKKNKRFLNFIKKQGVILSMLPDPNLKFDFYNSFMASLFPKNPALELKLNDPAADKKILKFANLVRASYFQLVRNSLINDFETFMSKSYMCYKFAFVNLQSFIMKNYQFHQFFENYNSELPPTIFHILNHPGLMDSPDPPGMEQLYAVYKETLGIEFEKKKLRIKEEKEKRKQREMECKNLGEHHHDHKKKLPEVPSFFKNKLYGAVEMNSKNKQIMQVYNYKARLVKVNDTLFEDKQMVTGIAGHIDIDGHHQVDGSMDSFDAGRSIGSAAEEVEEEIKEEDLFDTLQKMMLLFENETEEDFLLAFWETFLRFLTTNRMKDHHTGIDLEKLALDFLYLRTLSIFSRTLLSERVIQMKQPNIPDFDEMCQFISGKAELRTAFIEEMVGLVQRIVVSCILVFDFDKCLEITSTLELFAELKTNKENLLNHMLGFLQKGLTVDVILSPKMWELSSVYKNFFYAWRDNLTEFLKKTRNPFELMHKNIVEIKPLVVQLPSNFNEFNSEYLPRKCDLCGEFCTYCQTVLCLLCGKVFCKEKCQKKAHKKMMLLEGTDLVNIDTYNSQPTQESETPLEPADRSMSIENDTPLIVTRKSSATHLAKKNLNKLSHKPSAPNLGRPNKLKASTTIMPKKKNIDILTFDDNLNVEQGNARNGKLSPVFDKKSLVTPIKTHKIPSHIDLGSDWDKLSSVRGHGQSPKNAGAAILKSLKTTGKKSPPRGRHLTLDTRFDPKSAKAKSSGKIMKEQSPKPVNKFTIKKGVNPKIKGAKTETKLDQTHMTDNSRDYSIDSQGKKKKKKKRTKRGNMHKHAEECHKGHTVYVSIQDQKIIMFSKPREVVYPEKLYVDRFGQELKDKVNIVEEDWNFFEVNPFVVRRLRDAVENHSLPQLIYSIMKNHFKPSTT